MCECCDGTGWCDHSAGGVGPMAFVKFECPDCHNPEKLPEP